MNKLYLIQSTDATIHGFKKTGLWERQKEIIEKYTSEFEVHYFTSDWKNYQIEMPPNSYHHSSQISKNIFGYRHLIFYVYLIYSSFSWSGKSVIRVFGVTIPILKYLKYICKKNLIISYQYDWAEQTRANYKNIKHFLSRTIEKSALYSADYIFCTMPWLDEKLNKYYKIPSYKHEVIPNFVNLKYFYPEKKENIIIYAGRLHWSKGVGILIDAFKIFMKKNTDFKLILIGDGEENDELKEKALFESRIIFTGNISHKEVAQYFRKSKIFVLSTITMEGHPKSLIEAMAAGCICLASSVPGNNDVLSSADIKSNLFKPNDVSELANKLEESLLNNNANKSLEFARQNYSFDVLIEKEIKILKSFLR